MPSSRKTPRRTRTTPRKAGRGARRAGSGAGGKSRAPAARPRVPGPGDTPAGGTGAPARRRASVGRAQSSRPALIAPATPDRTEGATDPAGFFVARVRGEEAVREAPHPMAEAASDTGAWVPEGVPLGPSYDEDLGELPWGYGDDAVVALPRDPRSLFLYWDHAGETLRRGYDGLDHPRAQLWLFAGVGAGWERIRTLDVALESRGYYLHDLEPGRTYRAEIRAVDRAGRERLLGPSSNEIALPPFGPSAVADDRFVRLPWDRRLGGPLGPGIPCPGFPDDARESLARLSGWTRAGTPRGGSAGLGGAAAGGMGGRPSSPGSRGEGER